MGVVHGFRVGDATPLAAPSSRAADSTKDGPSKLLGLELLRFASALAVLVYHYNHFLKIPGALPIARSDSPVYQWLWPLYEYGEFGVELFWGISGYIFFWKYGRAIHAGAVSATRFFWLRFSRLYPLHFATLILVAGLQIVHRRLTGQDFVFPASDAELFVRHLFLAADWGGVPSRSFNGPIWSVSAEVAVYAGFFLLLRRYAPSPKLSASVLLIGAALLLSGLRSTPVICAIFFFAGGVPALLPPLSPRQRILAASLGGLVVSAAAINGIMRDLGLVPWVILATLPFLLAALAGELPGLNWWQRGIEAAGNLTYSTYLVHFPLQLMFAIAVARIGTMPDPTHHLFLLTYLAIALAAGAISYRVFELPSQKWIRRRMLKMSAA